MKKILTLFLALTVLAGCSKDESPTPAPAEPVGGAISLRSEGALENEPAAKAATRSEAAAEQALTYTFEAWTRGANPRCVLHKTAAGTLTEAAIEIALVPGSYDFLFWADYGTGAYETGDLRQVAAKKYTPAAASERDAFACVLTDVQWNGGNAVSAELKRPLAKLKMRNRKAFGTGGEAVAVTYTDVPTQYDVLTGTASAPQTLTLAFPTTTSGSDSVGEDFLFVPSSAEHTVGLSVTVGSTTRTLDVLPLRPNCTSRVTATFE